jgi:hypothetical protein
MTQRRSVRTALLTLTLTAASFVAAAVLAGSAQAATTSSAPVSAAASAGSFARVAYDSAKIGATKTLPATVDTVATTAGTIDAPLPGFCTLDGISGATSFISCSVVVPATVFVLCSSGAIFSGFLPAPGIYSLTATPCFATGYALV